MDKDHPLSSVFSFQVRALLVGERIDTRTLDVPGRLAMSPLVVGVPGGGLAVVFRYGAVVFFHVSPLDESGFLQELRPMIVRPFAEPELEESRVRIDSEIREGVSDDTIHLHDQSIERMQLVADILAKSVLLDLYESRVSVSFERIEPLAVDLEHHGRGRKHARELLKHIGGALLSEQKMVGRAEVTDKPEILWERPDLERVYSHLEDEFEIRERYQILERKLELIARTAHTVVQIQHDRRSLRVEWYIVILILVEILLFSYELFLKSD